LLPVCSSKFIVSRNFLLKARQKSQVASAAGLLFSQIVRRPFFLSFLILKQKSSVIARSILGFHGDCREKIRECVGFPQASLFSSSLSFRKKESA